MMLNIFIVTCLYSHLIYCFHREALEVNTEFGDYKELKEGLEFELTCENTVSPLQAVLLTPPSNVPYDAYTLDVIKLKDRIVFTLNFKNAKREYAGEYICKSHAGKESDELKKVIYVGVKPKIKFLVNRKELARNKQYKISHIPVKIEIIDIDTFPKPSYKWKKDGKALENENSSVLCINESGTVDVNISNQFNFIIQRVVIIIDEDTLWLYGSVSTPTPNSPLLFYIAVAFAVCGILSSLCFRFWALLYSSIKSKIYDKKKLIILILLCIACTGFVILQILRNWDDFVLLIFEIIFSILIAPFMFYDGLCCLIKEYDPIRRTHTTENFIGDAREEISDNGSVYTF